MPVDPNASLVITSLAWVPDVVRGHVRDFRPRWACEEIGLAYAEQLLETRGGKPESFFDEQPWGQVPVIHDGGIRLFESGAAMLHIAEKDTRLLPNDAQARALAISWLFAALNSIEPLMFELTNVTFFAKGEEWAKLRRPSLDEFLGGRLDRLADALGDKDYLEGDFTIGDLAMASVLRIAEQSRLMKARPVLAAYLARCLARPSFQRAIDAQIASFVDKKPEGESQ